MSFLDQGFLDSGYLEEAASRVASEHPDLVSDLPAPTSAMFAGLSGIPQPGMAGTITIPFLNITLTKKQALFLAVVVGLAVWLYTDSKKKKKRG